MKLWMQIYTSSACYYLRLSPVFGETDERNQRYGDRHAKHASRQKPDHILLPRQITHPEQSAQQNSQFSQRHVRLPQMAPMNQRQKTDQRTGDSGQRSQRSYFGFVRLEDGAGQITSNAAPDVQDGRANGADQPFQVGEEDVLEGDGQRQMKDSSV